MRARFVNESLNDSLNEEFNLEKIKNIISKVKDKKILLSNLINKFNSSTNINLKKYISTIITILFFTTYIATINKISHQNIDTISTEISKKDNLTVDDLFKIIKSQETISKYAINIVTARMSKQEKENLKETERLRLKAYSIGDGNITIGWGHAEPKRISNYKLGDVITEKEANLLFKNDIKKVEDGVKRLFIQWKKQNIDVPITQNMFDSMVSMAYNMGVSGFRQTDFAKYLKSKNYLKAAEQIKKTHTKSKVIKANKPIYVNMPGLEKRRIKEYELFTKDLE